MTTLNLIDKRQVQGSEHYLMNVEIIQKHEDASIEQNQLLNHRGGLLNI